MSKAQTLVNEYRGGSLDLRGCDLAGVKLPDSVGVSLYLRGCDLAGVDFSGLRTLYGNPGRVACARSDHILWLGDSGLYYAGCRGPFTRDEALAHWGSRADARAVEFTAAIRGVAS